MAFKYHKLIVVVLLAVVFLLPFFSAQNFSPATDEITHLPSGYSYWKTGEITLNPQHPPLVKLAAGLPLFFMDLKFDANDPNLIGPVRNEWAFGQNLLSSNNIDRLLLWGRLPVMLVSVLLGFYIYKWASEMFSVKAGLLSLFLYAFMPVMIANAQFVTTDLALAAFSFVTFYYLWRFIKFNDKRQLAFSGIFLGLALGSKFSAIIFLPVIALLLLVYAWRRGGELNVKIRRLINFALIGAVPAFIVLYLVYLMPSDLGFYIKGLRTIYADWKPGYQFYLNGNFSPDSRWYYFLEAFLLKTPIPALIAFAASILFYKKTKMDGWSKALVFLPVISFALVTSIKAHNISIRYFIPVIPFLILYTGGLATVGNDGSVRDVRNEQLKQVKRSNKRSDQSLRTSALIFTFLILSIWHVYSAVRAYPDYMPYFNELIGGLKSGYKYRDDSNVEWVQDLKRLGKYQAENPDTKVIYSWRNASPEYYGVKNFMMADDSGWWREPKGRYAVNTFLLIRMQLLSEQRKDPSLNWVALYEPVDRIGQSFFVYEFK